MQFSPTAAVDLMSTGRPDNTSAGKTGQESAFASHLVTAAQGQTASTRQPETGGAPKNTSKTDEKTINYESKENAQQTAAPSDPNSSPVKAENQPVAADAHDKRDSAEDLTAGTTLNGSAGAATAAIIPVLQANLDVSNLVEQSRSSASDQSNSIVSRMLNAITSVAPGTAAVVTANNQTVAVISATPPALQSATPTTPGQVQPVTIGEPQPLASVANLPAGLPENMAIAATAGPNFATTSGLTPADAAPLQSPTTALFSVETTLNNGTASTAQTVNSAPANTATVEPDSPQSIAQQNAALVRNEQVVQNQYGQIITIHQLSDPEGMAATGVGVKTPATVTGSQSQELNNNFIRSHLPNDASKTVTNENSAQQQQTSKDNQPKDANPAEAFMEGASLAEQTASQKPQFTIGSENQSLVFTHQGASSPLAASTSSTDALTLRLPSGLAVPDGSVVDQMLSHFTVNKQLESGTVNLKLHPQELGELRMEIKVDQDNIRAHIVAQNPQAQEMIERHLPRLRETLAQQGLQLQHIEVTVAANDNAGGERYQDNTGQQLNQSLNKHAGQSIFTLDSEDEMMESVSSVNNLSVLA